MKKNAAYFINGCLLLLTYFTVYSQNPTISSSFPKFATPSPTVSGLMKFEEIPVNNYTGVPDISIPLFSVQTRSQDIALNLSLNYHPASIAANEIAAYAGLGWNLFAGGSISRTVRGFPDEICKGEDPKRYGMYCPNNIYKEIIKYRDIVGNINTQDFDFVQQYIWEAVEKSMYDTEHDLYQYNFMGYSGRFYIEKIGIAYDVKKLDNNNAIEIDYNGTYFTVTDDKGYKYIFDVTEKTTINTTTNINYFGGGFPGGINGDGVTNLEYVSAYHLSRIEDNITYGDANILASFNYYSTIFPEIVEDISESKNELVKPNYEDLKLIFNNSGCFNPVFPSLEPELVVNIQNRTTATKKLESIIIPNKAIIQFIMAKDRMDSTFKITKPTEYRLQKILINDWNSNLVKKYELFHSYSEVKEKNVRMMLDRVTENDTQSYLLSYATSPAQNPYSTNIGVDYWGFFNLRPSNRNGGIYREASSAMCITDVLTGMTLPTGGTIDYEFEANQYSYVGEIRLEDFSENPDRFLEAYETVNLSKRMEKQHINHPFLKITDPQFVSFSVNRDPNNLWENISWLVYLCNISEYNTGPGQVIVSSNECPNYCSYEVELQPNWYYSYVEVMHPDAYTTPLNYTVTARYLIQNPDTYNRKYLIGGGVRIKSISHLGGKKSYNYDFHNEKGRSSGSLAYPKPIFVTGKTVRHNVRARDCTAIPVEFLSQPIAYKTTTSFDNLKGINTQGAYVGYQNVSVSQTGYIPGNAEVNTVEVKNGKVEYVYTSPIDVPLTEYTINYESKPNPSYNIPNTFLAPVNRDYKRGILKNEKYRDVNDKLLSEVIYDYKIDQDSIVTGIRPRNDNECPLGKIYGSYIAYMTNLAGCTTTQTNVCYNCGTPSAYLSSTDVKEVFGWVKLKSKITKNYFYDKDNTQNILDVKETYDYNTDNKKVKYYSKETYKGNLLLSEKLEERYTYLFNDDVSARNDISKILTVTSTYNGKQISYQKINYSPSLSVHQNQSYLPAVIEAAKGEQAPDNKLRFNRYDIFGSPVEVQRENGTPVVYLYDCNSRNLIAMIENATYAEVENILGASDILGYCEASIANNNDIRGQLNNARITTYTYIPLIGISSITDPRGQKTTYSYDDFGRLIQVKDHNGNILSENVYKYSTQN